MTLRAPPAERGPLELLSFGLVPLDKPPGPSSHEVSAWVRDAIVDALERATEEGVAEASDRPNEGVDETVAGMENESRVESRSIDRAAHAGTLDPKVTGCLPIMTGGATRLARAFLEGRKEYVAVLECHAPVPNDLEDVIGEFVGPIYQKPPRKSAVARRLRVRTVHALEVLDRSERQVLLRIECESGTYVRKLCHDIGLALGTGAHMGDLRRTRTEPFDDSSLVTMHDFVDALEFWIEDGDASPLSSVIVPAERALAHLPAVIIDRTAAREVANGAPVYAPGVRSVESADEDHLVACFTPDGAAVCLGRFVGDPAADSGVVVDLERVLV